MNKKWRRLDNTAKIFSMEEYTNNNTFRLSVVLKEKINASYLKDAVIRTLIDYPSYKVRVRAGFFWNYLENNDKDIIIEEETEMPCESINFVMNNDYLFKVTYFDSKINLDICHILTDGVGATIFLKSIIYNYLNIKKDLDIEVEDNIYDAGYGRDQYLKRVDKSMFSTDKSKNIFFIKDKSDLNINKTYHYVVDVTKLKTICKRYDVSITVYLTAIYIYCLYKTLYDKNKYKDKDIYITVPVDLRKHFNVYAFSNFFTCMDIKGNINRENVTFLSVVENVKKEFENKLQFDNLKGYLSRDVKLGTNVAIRLVPLFVKKSVMRLIERKVRRSTTTLSNIGSIKFDERYNKYIDNVLIVVNPGKIQKVKCTICSFNKKLTITINSNLVDDKFEKEFTRLLEEYIGKIDIESNN